MKKGTATIAILSALTIMAATACGNSGAGNESMDVTEHYLKLSDGRTVLCIETTRLGSWSCDWDSAG